MKHVRYDQVELQDVEAEGAEGVRVRWLIAPQDGAPNFFMRRFELAPGGHTPRHTHEWEHEVYILEGDGVVLEGDAEKPFAAGDALFVPGGVEHFFRAGEAGAAFLCLVPKGAGGCGKK